MERRHEARLSIPAAVDPALVTGLDDELLNVVDDRFDADVTVRGDEVIIAGNAAEVKTLTQLFSGIFASIEAGSRPDAAYVERAIQMLREDAYAPKELPYEICPRREGDIAENYANCDKARELMGWTAEYGIDDMCADSWRWQSMNPNGYVGATE